MVLARWTVGQVSLRRGILTPGGVHQHVHVYVYAFRCLLLLASRCWPPCVLPSHQSCRLLLALGAVSPAEDDTAAGLGGTASLGGAVGLDGAAGGARPDLSADGRPVGQMQPLWPCMRGDVVFWLPPRRTPGVARFRRRWCQGGGSFLMPCLR